VIGVGFAPFASGSLEAFGHAVHARAGAIQVELSTLADPAVVVSCDSVPMIEDAHLIINHMLTEAVRDLLAQEARP